ncbi:MAG: acetyltransferase [Candidatus Acidiferrales bacterium]
MELKNLHKSIPQLPIVLMIGSSWHASVLIDAIELAGAYKIVGLIDDTVAQGTDRRGYGVLGKVSDATSICAEKAADNVVVAIGDNWWRRRICADLVEQRPELKFPIIRHPSAIVAASAQIGKGAVILAGSHVGPRSQVGEFCILNTGSSIDHDCVMLNYSSIAPGVFTGGLVRVGECSAVGVGASISDRISIGSHTVIGTGAAVISNIPDFVVAYGNPARVQRPRREGEQYISNSA